jgi:ABC-type oligopeptide transport system substrate-binding subunit
MPRRHRDTHACALGAVALIVATTGAIAADARKTLHVAFPVAETGFDPQAIGDTYSDAVCLGIFDPYVRYDYFARPVVLEPNTADGLPEIPTAAHVHDQGEARIYFAADPAFAGKRRELTAEDYVYSIKRVFDPKVRSYWLYISSRRWSGSKALSSAPQVRQVQLRREDRGLQAVDRYTLRIRLQAAGLRLQMVADDVELRGGRARSGRQVPGRLASRDGEPLSAPDRTG